MGGGDWSYKPSSMKKTKVLWQFVKLIWILPLKRANSASAVLSKQATVNSKIGSFYPLQVLLIFKSGSAQAGSCSILRQARNASPAWESALMDPAGSLPSGVLCSGPGAPAALSPSRRQPEGCFRATVHQDSSPHSNRTSWKFLSFNMKLTSII